MPCFVEKKLKLEYEQGKELGCRRPADIHEQGKELGCRVPADIHKALDTISSKDRKMEGERKVRKESGEKRQNKGGLG